jgi:hypothetical protein
MGVDVGLPFATGPGPPGSLYAYGPFSAGPIPGPVGVWTFLSITTSFTLSGGGDVAALTGFVSIDAVAIPEPSTCVLAGLGLVVLIGYRARRRAA